MKLQKLSLFIATLPFLFTPLFVSAQCPSIEFIMVNSCNPSAVEEDHEFMVINSGPNSFNVNDLTIDFDMANNSGGAANGDIGPSSPCGFVLPSVMLGFFGAAPFCPSLMFLGPGDVVPANVTVLILTSSAADGSTYDWSLFCGSGQTIYVLQNSCLRDLGAFSNATGSSDPRTTSISIPGGGCMDMLTYDRSLLPSGDGDYAVPCTPGDFGCDPPDFVQYGNNGCTPPGIAVPCTDPGFMNPGNQNVCNSYTLLDITGASLTGNQHYYTGTMGTGTQLDPPTAITTTTTLFIYDPTQPCGEESFTVTVTSFIAIVPTTPLNICYTIIPPLLISNNISTVENEITGGNASLTVNWYLDMAGTSSIDWTNATEVLAAFFPTPPTEVYATVIGMVNGSPCESIMTVTVPLNADQPPTANTASATECDNGSGMATFDLTTLEGTIASGGEPVSFYTDMAASNSIATPGAFTISSSPTTVYAVVEGNNGCDSAPEAITLTISPPLDVTISVSPSEACDMADVMVTFTISGPDTYDFVLQFGNATSGFSTQNISIANGGNILISITETTEFSIFSATDPIAGCPFTIPSTAEMVTITPQPDIAPIADVSACGTYILPAIPFDANPTGSAAYFTGSGGTGTQFNIGDVINTTTTLFAYDAANPTCFDEEAFTITITPIPNLTLSGTADICPGDNFDLSTVVADLANSGLTITYHDNTPPNAGNQLPSSFVSPGGTTTYFAFADGGSGCNDDLAIQVTVLTPPTALPATLSACDEGGNMATFDLTSENNTVNDGTGNTVNWFTDVSLSNPINNPTTFLSASTTVFANVTNGVCPSAGVSITLTVLSLPVAAPAGPLEDCGDAGGQATFDLTNLNNTINGGSGNTVNWFTDAGATNPIANPAAFLSGNGTVFATVFDGNCNSLPISVSLIANATPDAFDLQLDECGAPNATFILTDPSVTDVINGGNGAVVSWFSDAAGTNPLINSSNFVIPFTVIVFATVEQNGCISTSAQVTLNVEVAPTAISTNMSVCDNGSGEGVFDLSSLNNTVNDGSGLIVNWFSDAAGTSPIFQTNNYTTAATTVFAQVENGNCDSEIVPVDLNVQVAPTANDQIFGACDTGAGTAFFDLTSLEFAISNSTGNVSWFMATNSMNPIGNPSAYSSASSTVFAVVDNGTCTAEAMVTLTVNVNPDVSIALAQAISCNGVMDAALAVSINNGAMPFDFDWNVNALDGTEDPSGLGAGFYALILTDNNNCQGFADITIVEPTELMISCSEFQPVSTVGGSDGQASIDISGGTLSYTLSWSGQASGSQTSNTEGQVFIANLEAGNYSLMVTDANNCETNCAFTITDPACSLSLEIAGTDPLCNGDSNGSIDLTINGGTANFTIDWDDDSLDGIEDPNMLMAGTYFVTVTDASSCESTSSVTLMESSVLTLNTSEDTPVSSMGGSDGVAAIDFSGGISAYVLNWTGPSSGNQNESNAGSTTLTNLSAGSYSLTLTDANNCESTSTFTINEPGCNMSLEVLGIDPLCAGDSTGMLDITINNGNAPFTTDWNVDEYDGLVDLVNIPAGTYGVTIIDADNCMANITFTLTDPTALVLNCSEQSPVSMAGGNDGIASIELSGGAMPYVLNWTGPLSGNQNQNFAGIATITDLLAGDYSLTLTDDNACETTCTFTITEPGGCNMSLEIIGINPLCAGDSTGLIDLTIIGGTSPLGIDWNVDAFDGFEDLIDIPAGNYTATVTDADNCIESISIDITTPAALSLSCGEQNPVTTPGGNDGVASIDYSGGTAPYVLTWSGPLSGNQNEANAGNITIPNLEAGLYSITLTDANNCTSICDFTINSAGCSMSLSITGFSASCFDSNDGRIELLVFNGANPLGFDWNVDALDGIQEPFGLMSMDYSVTVTDANGCIAIASVTIGAPAEIILDCGQINPVSAPGNMDGSASVGFAGGTAPYVLNWNGALSGSQNITTADTITLDNLLAGNYTLTLTDANDCEVECTFIIAAACAIELSLSPQNESCPGTGDGQITSTIINGTMPYVYDWNVDILDGIADPIGLDAGTYMLTVTDDAGCVAIDTTIVGAEPMPSLSISENGQICDGECFAFDLNFVGTPPFNVSYSVNDGNTVPLFFFTTMSTDTTIELCTNDFNLIGNTLTLIIEDISANNCSNPIDLLRTVEVFTATNELLNPQLCRDESVLVNGTTYDFNNQTGTEMMQNVAGCDSIIEVDLSFFTIPQSFIAEDLCEGESLIINGTTYDANNLTGIETLQGSSSNGCDSIVNINLTLIPAISATLSGSTNICAGDMAILVFNISTLGMFSVQYSGENGASTFLQNIMDGHSIEVSPANSTSYAIEFIIVAGTNCPILIENNATVAVSNLSAIAIIDQDILCDGEPIGSLSVETANGIAPYSYAWSTNQNTPSISDLSPATYSVVVTDAAGCTEESSATLIAPNAMQVWTHQTPPSCFDSETGSITIDSLIGGDGQFEYSFDGEFYQMLPPLPFTVSGILPGLQILYTQDGKDCVLQQDVYVPNVEELVLDLGIDAFIDLGESTTLRGIINFTADSLIWSPLDSLESPNALITEVNPTHSMEYTLTVFDANGCFVSDQVQVIVNRDVPIYIPSIFSPNDDGINDVFMIFSGNGVVRVNNFMIFDRWGNAVFQVENFLANDPLYGWDGKYRGQSMNPAVFVYSAEVLLADGRVEKLKGDVTLVR